MVNGAYAQKGTVVPNHNVNEQAMTSSQRVVFPTLNQYAPYPTILHDLVERLKYRQGWTFALEDIERDEGAGGLTLVITTDATNSYRVTVCDLCHSPRTGYRVHHYFSVPAATYDERSWQRWLFDRIVEVEVHEASEFFALWNYRVEHDEDTPFYVRPYAPSHGPGNNPYTIRELSTLLDQRTRFTGEVATT